MSYQINNENDKLDDTLINASIVIPLVTISCLLLAVGFLTGQTFTTSPLLVSLSVAVIVLFSLSHIIPQLKFSKWHAFYISAYHLIFAGVIIFIAPVLSYYLILWILLAYLAEFYFQKKGLFISLLTMLLSILIGIAYQQPPFTLSSIASILPWFLLLTVVILMLSRLLLGTKKFRDDMAKKIALAEFDHQRLMALINSMNEAVIAVNQNGKINIFNSSALELLDTNSNIAGKNIDDIFNISDAQHNDQSIMKIARTAKYILKKSDLYLELNSKTRIAIELSISRTTHQATNGSDNGFTFIIRDITKQKKIDDEKDDFISVVSHELRTPIAVSEASIAMAQLVAKKSNKESTQISQSLENAHHQIMFLSEMINDLSTLSRAERDDKQMTIETFEVSEVLSELEDTFKPLAAKKNISYTTQTEAGLPQVTTSKLYLTEILQNLISNAVKYSDSGNIKITAVKNSDRKIHIAVKDTGIGISLANQEKVFDKFWRSEDVLTRKTDGTGLGLFIASRLARRINAIIDVKSETGKGSKFELILAAIATKEVDSSNVVNNEVENLLN